MPVVNIRQSRDVFVKTAVKEGKQRVWLQMRKNQERLANFYLIQKIYLSKMQKISQDIRLKNNFFESQMEDIK